MFDDEIQDANIGAVVDPAKEYEFGLSYKQTLQKYKPVVLWSFVYAIAIVGEGFDLALFGNFFSLPAFQRLFGVSGQISPQWQSGILTATLFGQVLGMCIAGYALDRLGYKKTMMMSLAATVLLLSVDFSAPWVREAGGRPEHGLSTILVGEFLLGFPWGSFQGCVLAYTSDISPAKLRPALTTFVSMCWIFGQLISTGAIRAVFAFDASQESGRRMSYCIPVGLQWIWPPILLVLIHFSPESPWWLVRHRHYLLAILTLGRLNKDAAYPVFEVARVIRITNAREKVSKANNSISYVDCFRSTNRRRTMIVVMIQISQQLCGSTLMFYSAKLFQKAGMSPDRAFDMTMVQYALGLVAIGFSWPLMNYVGRRAIWNTGLLIICVLMTTIGGLGFFLGPSQGGVPWTIAGLLIFFTVVYNLSVGPLAYAVVPEIPSSRLKAKTIIIGRAAYLMAGLVNVWLVPKLLEDKPAGFGFGPKMALLYAATTAILLICSWFHLPEVVGRTPIEMDQLFERGVSARKFASTKVDMYQA